MTLLLHQTAAVADFELESERGDLVRLHDGHEGPTLLVFFRGHWCPYCRRYLGKLQANHWRFARRNVRLLAISPEPVDTSRALAADLRLAFPILSDSGGGVIDRFGVRNGPSSASTILPHPAVILLDGAGVVRFRKVDRNFKRRTTMHRIFLSLDSIAGNSD